MSPMEVQIPARDGFPLAATVYEGGDDVVVINSAMATPRRFYRHFATRLADESFTVVTYDYRGVGGSAPEKLRGFATNLRDWAFLDMDGVIDWVHESRSPRRVFLIGHSFGGQVAGLLANGGSVDGMVTMSSQSGHWRQQGGEQKAMVFLHTHVTLPVLSHVFGYMPWSKVGAAEDLPKDAALEWAGWCRNPRYLLDDQSLPLERYQSFDAPVLAYSIDDDKWGTAASVDAMMGAYPNLERRHVLPRDVGLERLGHFGFFRPKASALWDEPIDWLRAL